MARQRIQSIMILIHLLRRSEQEIDTIMSFFSKVQDFVTRQIPFDYRPINTGWNESCTVVRNTEAHNSIFMATLTLGESHDGLLGFQIKNSYPWIHSSRNDVFIIWRYCQWFNAIYHQQKISVWSIVKRNCYNLAGFETLHLVRTYQPLKTWSFYQLSNLWCICYHWKVRFDKQSLLSDELELNK